MEQRFKKHDNKFLKIINLLLSKLLSFGIVKTCKMHQRLFFFFENVLRMNYKLQLQYIEHAKNVKEITDCEKVMRDSKSYAVL